MTDLYLFCPKCKETVSLSSTETAASFQCKKCDGPLFFDETRGEAVSPESSAVLKAHGLEPGRRFGDFDILEVVGSGGMGKVYKARNLQLNRTVALKVMRPEFAESDPENVRRLHREAQAAAQLIHPNIVALFSVGEHDALNYIEMEYVAGPTAGGLVDERGKLDLALGVMILRDAAQGLAAAHKLKIVHRDIKPDNILVHPDGLAKVSDFGLAKSFADAQAESGELKSDITLPGIAIGTPHFMSPEQCEAQGLDGRSDLYSLGCTFYFLITGSRPYRGESTMGVMRQHLFDPPPDVTIQDETIPEEIAAIIFRTMDKDLQKRYQTAEELVKDIDDLVLPEAEAEAGGSELTAEFRKRPIPTTTDRPKTKRARPRTRTSQRMSSAATALPRAAPATPKESHLLPVVLGVTLSLMVVITVAAVALVAKFRPGGDYPKETVTTTVSANGGDENDPGNSVVTPGGDHPETYRQRFYTTIYDVALNEETMVGAAAGDDWKVHLWEVLTGKEVRNLKHKAAVTGVSFSPDGSYLAAAAGTCLKLWRTESYETPVEFESKYGTLTRVAFSLDNGILATGSETGVQIREMPSGVVHDSLETESKVTALAWGPDNQTLVAGDSSGTVYVWKNLKADRYPDKKKVFKGRILSVQMSHDHQWLVVSSPGTFVLWNLVDDRKGRPIGPQDSDYLQVAIAPDFSSIALGLDDGTAAFVDANEPDKVKRVIRLHGTESELGAPYFHQLRFSHDGAWLMSAGHDGSVALVKAAGLSLDKE